MIKLIPRTPSRTGYELPLVAKAATVMGTNDADRMRSNIQWYEPSTFEEGGNGVASLTVPRRMAVFAEFSVPLMWPIYLDTHVHREHMYEHPGGQIELLEWGKLRDLG